MNITASGTPPLTDFLSGDIGEAGAAAAQAGPRRQRHRQREAERDRGVRRVAAGRQDVARQQRGARLVRHHPAEEALDVAWLALAAARRGRRTG